MQAHLLMALDPPPNVLAWDAQGQTKIAFLEPVVMAARHLLSIDLTARLAAIGPLTDELVA